MGRNWRGRMEIGGSRRWKRKESEGESEVRGPGRE